MKMLAALAMPLVVWCSMASAAEPQANGADAYLEAFRVMEALPVPLLNATSDGDAVPLSADTDAAVKAAGPALAALHRGAQVGRCDWHTDFSKGLQIKLPYIPPAQVLAITACLSARVELETHNTAKAAQDFADAMQLATDMGTDGLPVVVIAAQRTQWRVARCITANGAKLDKANAATLLARIPKPDVREQLKAAFRRDKELTVAALPKLTEADLNIFVKSDVDVAAISELPDHVDDVAKTYDRMIALLDMTPSEADNEAKAVRKEYQDAKNPTSVFVFSVGRALQHAIDTDKAMAAAREELAKR